MKKHYIVKRVSDSNLSQGYLSESGTNLYTLTEARNRCKRLSAQHGDRYGIFQLVEAYEPVDNVKSVDVDKL